MKTLCTHSLPKEKMSYLLRSGEGERYLFGRQVATVMANGRSTGDLFEIVLLSGEKEMPFRFTSTRTHMKEFSFWTGNWN